MCKDKENSSTETNSQKSYWYIPTITAVFIVIFAISIIAIVYFICVAKIPVSVTDEGLVITFLGVIATFVVVGNFMQTAEIKRETIDRLHENKKAITTLETSLNDKIQTQRDGLSALITESETNSSASVSRQIASFRKNVDDALYSTASNVSEITEGLISLLGKTLLFVENQKKLFIEFLKGLATYKIEYKTGDISEIELKEDGVGRYSIYDLKQGKTLVNNDYSQITKICDIPIKDKARIEAVLDAYGTYVKIISFTIPSTSTSGEQDSSKYSQDNNDTSLSDVDNGYKETE